MSVKISSRFLVLGTILVLVLVACSSPERSSPSADSLTPVPGPTATPVPGHSSPALPASPTPAPEPTTTPVSTEASTESAIDPCLVGEWKLVDMSAYMITAMESADIEVEYEFSTGQAIYLFSVDGVFLLQADQRTENYTMKFESGDLSVDVPISTAMDGFGSARYSAADGRVAFTNTGSSGLVFQVTVFEETLDMDFWGADDTGGEVVFLYECVGPDTLHLTPPINDYAVFPVILQRNR